MSAAKQKPTVAPIGDSWDIKHWPSGVWPHDPKRADWIVRSNKTALTKAGVLSRPCKRVLVINGDAYRSWLFATEKQRAVNQFENNLTQGNAS